MSSFSVAKIVMNVPTNRAPSLEHDLFSYEIPASLRGRVQPGSLVWAPFGGRRLQGVVFELESTAPADVTLRPIESLALPEPVLSDVHLRLARWLSERYLAPLREAVFLMLPGGVAQRVEIVLALQGGAALPNDLSEAQLSLLERLQRGDATQRNLKKENPTWTRSNVLKPLIQRGLITRRDATTRAAARPQIQQRARLLKDRAAAEEILPTLGRRSKQADALAMLARQPGHAMPQDALQKLAGCGAEPIRALAQRGLVAISKSKNSPDPIVALSISVSEVNAHLIALRGAEKYQTVLEILFQSAEPVWARRLMADASVDLKTLRDLEKAELLALDNVEVMRDPLAGRHFEKQDAPPLTAEQQHAWQKIEVALSERLTETEAKSGQFFLLHGVTGSGKTEIYLRALDHALANGKQAIVLVPEISLTPQTINRFARRFPGQVAVWHSELSPGERFDTWRRMQSGELRVVIGPRSALFAPFDRLGVIVMDEEHDNSYKEHERAPRYHARAAAMRLAQLTKAVVIFGSATPSLETYHAAQRGTLELLTLFSRVRGNHDHALAVGELPDFIAMPDVEIVDLRQELRAGNRSIFSRSLQEKLAQTLDAGEQAILFLNRRGHATGILCRDCGHVEQCSRCGLPMTLHAAARDEDAEPALDLTRLLSPDPAKTRSRAAPFLLCHHCNRRRPLPATCAQCGSTRLQTTGAGTQRIEELVRDLFPQARPLRWDRDVTQTKGAHDAILQQFSSGAANVLIGTQMIAKGLDLPLVTLVGVINADIGLYLPDFRAAEHTFQVLMQVAGRAGRSQRSGRVIVQTYAPDHYAIRSASQHDYLAFFNHEMAYRRQLEYPPYARFLRLIYSSGNPRDAETEARRVAQELQRQIAQRGLAATSLVGPAPCFIERLRYRYRWHLLLRSKNNDASAIVRALNLPLGWQVDVDPVNLL